MIAYNYVCVYIPVKVWFKSTIRSIGQSALSTVIAGSERDIKCKICIGNARATGPRVVTVRSARVAHLAGLHEGKKAVSVYYNSL